MSVVKRFDQILFINSQIKLNLKKPNQTIALSYMLRLFPALLTFTVLVPYKLFPVFVVNVYLISN